MIRLLIVEDSGVVRRLLNEMLAGIPGVEVCGEAGDAVCAIESVRSLKPDVMTLDIQLPVGSGLDVLRNIRGERKAPRVIVLTNHPYPQYRKKCLTLGADYFFDKSTEFTKVVDVLTEMTRESLTA